MDSATSRLRAAGMGRSRCLALSRRTSTVRASLADTPRVGPTVSLGLSRGSQRLGPQGAPSRFRTTTDILHGPLAILLVVILGAAIDVRLAMFEPIVDDLGERRGRGRDGLGRPEAPSQPSIAGPQRPVGTRPRQGGQAPQRVGAMRARSRAGFPACLLASTVVRARRQAEPGRTVFFARPGTQLRP